MSLRIERVDVGRRTFTDLTLTWVESVAGLLPARPATHEPATHEWLQSARYYLALTIALDLVIAGVTVSIIATREYATATAVVLGLTAALGFVMSVALGRGYRVQHVADPAEWRATIKCAGIIALAAVTLDYFAVVSVPRSVMLPAMALTIGLTSVSRLAQRAVVRRRRAHGLLLRRTLLVGRTEGLDHAFGILDEPATHGLTVVGLCTPEGAGATTAGVLGTYDAIPGLVDEHAIDVVLVTADAMAAGGLRDLGWKLRERRTTLLVLPPLTDVSAHRLHIESTASIPLLNVSFRTPRPRRWAKEALDRTVGAAMLTAALAVILPAALVVRLTSRGPAFFAQQRVGLDGEVFTMHKLRSMYTDAEARLDTLKEQNEGNGMLFKLREDPRVTPIGRILRRCSIDELPQLWNIVRGDMALVGPRPALPREVAEYDDVTAHRLLVKPGLTGLWQVSGRSDLSVEKSVRLDLKYVDNWTIGMDLHTIGRTARAVINGRGAY